MEEIIKKLENRRKQLKMECLSNKIRINEIDRIIDLLKKERRTTNTVNNYVTNNKETTINFKSETLEEINKTIMKLIKNGDCISLKNATELIRAVR